MPKLRLIQAPPFCDRVVHHALVRVIGEAFGKKIIADTYACIKGRGTHAASRRLRDFMQGERAKRRGHPFFVLKADISKYFPNINHDILMRTIRRTVYDTRTLWLIERIIKSNGFTDKGVPIGALTSQLFANVYLDAFDHFMKETMRIRSYIRYMDDFVILHHDKEALQGIQRSIEQYMGDHLLLRLNPKTSIFPDKNGIDFSGYRHWTSHTRPRKRTTKRMRRQTANLKRKYAAGLIGVEDITPRMASFAGYMKHCDGHITAQTIFDDAIFMRRTA